MDWCRCLLSQEKQYSKMEYVIWEKRFNDYRFGSKDGYIMIFISHENGIESKLETDRMNAIDFGRFRTIYGIDSKIMESDS